MASPHLFRTYGPDQGYPSGFLGPHRPDAVGLAHLLGMDAFTSPTTSSKKPATPS